MRKRSKGYRQRLYQQKLKVREKRAHRRLLLQQAHSSENGISGSVSPGNYSRNYGPVCNLQSSSTSNISLPLPFVGNSEDNHCSQVCGIKVEQELVIKEEPSEEYASSNDEQNRHVINEASMYEETLVRNLPVSQLTEEEDPLALKDGETEVEECSLSEGEPCCRSPSNDEESDSIVIVSIESQLSVSPEPGEALDFVITPDEDSNATEEMETHTLPSLPNAKLSPDNVESEKTKTVKTSVDMYGNTKKQKSNLNVDGDNSKSYQLRHHRQNSTDFAAQPAPSSSATHICLICNDAFGSGSKLSEHYTDHSIQRELQCQICQRIFPTFCKLRTHVNDYYIKKVKVPLAPELVHEFQCPVCDIIFVTRHDMDYHGQTHELSDDLVCKICVQCFPSFEKLVNHAKEHELDTFPCTVCNQNFKGRTTAVHHVLEKHKDYLETCCEFCGDRFPTPEDVEIHREQIHASDIQWVNKFQKQRIQKETVKKKKPVVVQESSKLRCCKKCGARVQARWMKSHQASTACRIPSWRSCKKCGEKFKDQLSFKAHKHVGFQCPFCPSSLYHYPREKALLRHLAISHLTPEGFVEFNIPPDAERNCVCKKCGVSYTTSKALKEHKLYHGIPAFQCPDCPEKVFTNYQLFRHKMKEHGKYTIGLTKGQSIVCDQCPAAFFTRNGYIRHKKVAHCETPSSVLCDICGKSFNYKDLLRRHVREVHRIHANVNKE